MNLEDRENMEDMEEPTDRPLGVRNTQVPRFNSDGSINIDDPFESPSVAAAIIACKNYTLSPPPYEVITLCHCPAIHMIFRDFIRNCWSHPRNALHAHHVYEASAIYYHSFEAPVSWRRPSGLSPSLYPPSTHNALYIADFMLRCRDFVNTQTDPFFAAAYNLGSEGASRMLIALLGVCMRAYKRRAFPEGPLEYDGSIEWPDLGAWLSTHCGSPSDRLRATEAVNSRWESCCVGGDLERDWLLNIVYSVDGPAICPICYGLRPVHNDRCCWAEIRSKSLRGIREPLKCKWCLGLRAPLHADGCMGWIASGPGLVSRFCAACKCVAPFHKADCSDVANVECKNLFENIKS
ncbi:hypothetical protein F4810DRAFT_664431 [Camillea tinctor]|nr:hypothetical protein F4810DRAFT_664431 [Camillea tinctor]